MAGHSKWANIKHKKAASDAVKGKMFSKLAKEIMVAARLGGGDPKANITLRAVVQKARGVSMPTDNIERAIKKGSGELEGGMVEEIIYEGFAPGGVAVVIQVMTDNRNRTASEVRHVFTKSNGNLAAQGSVTRSFKRKGQILIKTDSVSEDKLLEVALEAGAEDVKQEGDLFEVITEMAQYATVSEAITAAGIKPESSDLTMLPDMYVPVTNREQATQLIKFIEALEELDDVQNVYANFDIDDAMLEAISKA